MKFKLLHCWDCGVQVVGESYHARYALPNLREVIFDCSDGSYMESPFCEDCAGKPWPQERTDAFHAAVSIVNPKAKTLHLTHRGTSTRDHSGTIRVVE